MLFLSINGQEDQNISSADRAFNYGDGLFTTAKVYQGKIDYLDKHIARLQQGCEKLFIHGVDFKWLKQHVAEVASTHSSAVLKMVISAGQGGRGYSRQGIGQPNVVVSVYKFPQHFKILQSQGIRLGVASTMLGLNPQLAGIKHLNRLEQVLIRHELDNRREDDLLVLNIHQDIIEASSANVFYQRGNKWYTPDLLFSGVNGIIRQEILKNNTEVTVKKDKIGVLDDVTAMFICNCVFGIVPVKCFNNTELDLMAVKVFKERHWY